MAHGRDVDDLGYLLGGGASLAAGAGLIVLGARVTDSQSPGIRPGSAILFATP